MTGINFFLLWVVWFLGFLAVGLLLWIGIRWLFHKSVDALGRREDRIIAKERKAFDARQRLAKAVEQDRQAEAMRQQLLRSRGKSQ